MSAPPPVLAGGPTPQQNNPDATIGGVGGGGESSDDRSSDLQAEIENYKAAEKVQNAYALSALRLPTADPVPSAVSVRLGMPDKL